MFKTIIINKKDSIYKNMFFDNLSQFTRGIKKKSESTYLLN